MVQISPGAHGKLSQDAVAEGRRIAFAVARKGHDAPRENFSFFLFLVVGQVEPAADLIKGNRNRFDVVRPTASHPKNGAMFIAFSSDTRSVGTNALPEWSARRCG
jgi:hypothetical protein